MSTALVKSSGNALQSLDEARDFVTLYIADQLFGIPVLQVQDVLNPMPITRVPLAPAEVAGALNLRGRIVTAIDVRTRLNLSRLETIGMSIVVEHKGELYSLLVDTVGEVISCQATNFEPSPPTLDTRWRDVSDGVYRLDGRLMIVLDVSRLLNFVEAASA